MSLVWTSLSPGVALPLSSRLGKGCCKRDCCGRELAVLLSCLRGWQSRPLLGRADWHSKDVGKAAVTAWEPL